MRIFIYGAGRVGRSLARAIEQRGADHGLTLTGTWNRSFKRAFQTSRLVQAPASSGDILPEPFAKSDAIFLTVTDDAIAPMAERLAPHLKPHQQLIHTSGSLASTHMRQAAPNTPLGSCHPLQSLASDDGDPDLFQGSTFAVEGDPGALETASRVAEAVGGEPLTIRPAGKTAYHAAAVVSANYLTVLVDAARTLCADAGVSPRDAVRILAPLLQGTLHNLIHMVEDTDPDQPDEAVEAIARSLTGPVRRGDAITVKRHLKTLKRLEANTDDAADLTATYTLLARRALTMAERAGLGDDDAEALSALLAESDT